MGAVQICTGVVNLDATIKRGAKTLARQPNWWQRTGEYLFFLNVRIQSTVVNSSRI